MAIFGVGGLAAAIQEAPVKEISFPNASVRGLGVCQFTTDTATCWKMDGTIDSVMADRIKAQATTNNQSLNLRFGRRNCFLAVESQGAVSLQVHPPASSQGSWYGQSARAQQFQLIGIDADDRKGDVFLDATFSGLDGPPALKIDLKQGASATDGTNTLTIGDIKFVKPDPKAPLDPNPRYINGFGGPRGVATNESTWRIDVEYKGSVYVPSAQYAAFDKDGAPILYVDTKGNPVSAVTYLSEQPLTPYWMNTPRDPNAPKSRYLQASIAQSNQVAGAFTLRSNIDPSKIKYLTAKVSRTETKVIGPFPLEPVK